MAKRIVTKIGDVFCAEIDNQYKRFFQYIVIDSTMLNSSTIRAFKKHYPMDYVPNISEIVSDDIEFYAHTVLRAGILYGAWYKVGKSTELGNCEEAIFRMSDDYGVKVEGVKVSKSEKWYVWNINKPMEFVGKLLPKYFHAELGSVMSYISIMDRLKFGKYTHSYPGY